MFSQKLITLIIAGLMVGYTAPLMALDIEVTDSDYYCSEGFTLVDPNDARAKNQELCALLGKWDIVRLEGGGSMSGQGYGCAVFDLDPRGLGGSLCVELDAYVEEGDSTCPGGYTLVTTAAARDNQDYVCSMLGKWWICRLANGGSISGPGYECTVFEEDTRHLGASVCRKTLR
jgi:hypothetical protein